MGQDWSLTHWPHPSALFATRNPTGCSLGDVSTAYWNFFDEFRVADEHDTGKFEVCPVGLNIMRVAFYCVDVFLINQITLLLDFPLLPWGSSLMQSGFVSRAMLLRNVWMKRSGPPLPRNETVSRAISWEWNVKRCNGFLREPSLGVFTVAFSVWLHYHNPASRPSQVFINHC